MLSSSSIPTLLSQDWIIWAAFTSWVLSERARSRNLSRVPSGARRMPSARHESSLLQKGARLVEIEAPGLPWGGLVVPKTDAGRDEGRGREAGTAEGDVDDILAVDGIVDGLADEAVFQEGTALRAGSAQQFRAIWVKPFALKR